VLVALFLGSTYLALPNLWFAVLVLGLYLLIQQVENIWLRPQILSHSLRLHPGLVFVGVIGALALQGVLGALLIVPLMASFGILGRYLHCKMLGKEPWPSDPTAIEHVVLDSSGRDISVSVSHEHRE